MLKSYLKFFWLAIGELLPSRKRKVMRIMIIALGAFVTWILSTFFGVPLIRPILWMYNLLPGFYWAGLLLLAIILLLLYVIEGAQRLYERTLRELGAEVKAAEKLSRIQGNGEPIYRQCSPDAKEALPRNTLYYWLNDIENAISEAFGQQNLFEFQKSVKELPNGSLAHHSI